MECSDARSLVRSLAAVMPDVMDEHGEDHTPPDRPTTPGELHDTSATWYVYQRLARCNLDTLKRLGRRMPPPGVSKRSQRVLRTELLQHPSMQFHKQLHAKVFLDRYFAEVEREVRMEDELQALYADVNAMNEPMDFCDIQAILSRARSAGVDTSGSGYRSVLRLMWKHRAEALERAGDDEQTVKQILSSVS
tara:strand:+ start:232 stop:807 length:576 start_codon:yes stop_codon:yes gene_type:complete